MLAFETERGSVVMLINTSDDEKCFNFEGLSGDNAQICYIARDIENKMTFNKQVVEGTISDVFIPRKSVTFVITSKE